MWAADMKRTTKRRIGATGLAVSGILIVMFVISLWYNYAVIYSPVGFGIVRGSVGFVVESTPSLPDGFNLISHRFGARDWWPRVISNTSERGILLPIWMIIVPLLFSSVILWYRNRMPPSGHCRSCDYDLTGNVSGKCSECGKPIKQATP